MSTPPPVESRAIDTVISRRLPYPIAAAWHRVSLVSNNVERQRMLKDVLDNTLRMLLAISLPDYLAGAPAAAVEKRLPMLFRPSLGQYDELLYHVMAQLRQRQQPRAFAPEALQWYFDAGGKRSLASMRLTELIRVRNDDAHGPLGPGPEHIAREVREAYSLMRRLLHSLAWLQGYRPFRVVTQAPNRGGHHHGKIQFLTGVLPQNSLEPAAWKGVLLSDVIYLVNPQGTEVMELYPFVQVCPDPISGAERCFLFRSTPKGETIELQHDGTASVLPDERVDTVKGRQNFDSWLKERPKTDLRMEIEDCEASLGWFGPRPANVGQLLAGRFEIREPLGEGGMAHVYRVWDREFEEEVAIKVLKDTFVHDATFQRRFLREARQMWKMHHPGILKVLGVGHDEDGRAFLTMPVMPGGSLADKVVPGGQRPDQVIDWGLQILKSLRHLHGLGTVHRDVKPANLLVASDGRLKLADFGIALVKGEARLTSSVGTVGSPAYWAPEQRGEGNVCDRTDVFSTAMLLHELLVGELPTERRPGAGIDTPLGEILRHMGSSEPLARPSAQEATAQLEGLRPPPPPPLPVVRPAPAPPTEERVSASTSERERALALIEDAWRAVVDLRAYDDYPALRAATKLVGTADALATWWLCLAWSGDSRLMADYPPERELLERVQALATAHPDSRRAWLAAGIMAFGLQQVGQVERAVQALDRAVSMEPQDPTALLWLAMLQVLAGEDEKVRATLDAGEKLAQDSPLLHMARGFIALWDGDDARALDEARAMTTTSKRIMPAWKLGCEALDRLGQAKLRVQAAAGWCKLFPNCAAAALEHGRALNAHGRSREALSEFERAVYLDPRDPEPWEALGWMRLEAEQLGEALALLDRARAAGADQHGLAGLSAYTWLEANRGEEALVAARAAARAAPDSRHGAEVELLCLVATGRMQEAHAAVARIPASGRRLLEGLRRLCGEAPVVFTPGAQTVVTVSPSYRPGWLHACLAALDDWQPPADWLQDGHVPLGAWVAPDIPCEQGSKHEDRLISAIQLQLMAKSVRRAIDAVEQSQEPALRAALLAAFEHRNDPPTIGPAVDAALFSLRQQGVAAAAIERARLRVHKVITLLWAAEQGDGERPAASAPRAGLPYLPFGFWCQPVFPDTADLEAALTKQQLTFQNQVAALVHQGKIDGAIKLCNAAAQPRLLRLGMSRGLLHCRVLRSGLFGANRGHVEVFARLAEALREEKLKGASPKVLRRLIVAADHLFAALLNWQVAAKDHARSH